MDFARLIDFDLRKHGYDRERDGEFCACHVEKKLTLYFACDALIEKSSGKRMYILYIPSGSSLDYKG